MKLLLDSCIGKSAYDFLTVNCIDTERVANWSHDPGDKLIMQYAYRHKRSIVTLDKDFGELAVLHGISHSGIIRLINIPTISQGPVCLNILTKYETDLKKNAIISVTKDRIRIRLP